MISETLNPKGQKPLNNPHCWSHYLLIEENNPTCREWFSMVGYYFHHLL